MMSKSWKIKARTGGIRRKILKEYTRIMKNSNEDKNNAQQNDSWKVGCGDFIDGSVGIEYTYQNQDQADTANNIQKENIECCSSSDDFCNARSDAEYLRPESSEESEDDIDFDKVYSFRENVRIWAIERNITQIALKDLAKIMNELMPQILPIDPRTIIKTPRRVNIKTIEDGEYWHNGITSNLTLLLEKWTDVPECISLNLNFDGLPIFKSSKKEFWPILCNIYENPDIKPFVIGIYYGVGKPKNLPAYLEDFIKDVSHIIKNGISLVNHSEKKEEKKVTVKIRCFICDSPARAFIKGVCNFNGKHGCMKCITVGEYSHNSHTVIFPDTSCSERTNDGFRSKLYGAHHKIDSPLLNLPIDMVKDFPVGDSLHLVDLGIMKRLLVGWRDGNFGKYLTKWRATDIQVVTNFLNKCNMLPSEIHRAVRGLEYLAFWKATEYRTFLLYLSIIILPDVLTSAVFSHFLKFYCGITICSTERHMFMLPLAEKLLNNFVTHYKDFYGADYVTSNVHNLIHLTAEVGRFGPLHSFSAYPFENKLYCIKRLLRGGKNPLSQIANRIVEATEEFNSQNPERSEKPEYPFVTASRNNYRTLHMQQFKVSPKRKDRYVLTTFNEIVEIHNIVEETNMICINGFKITNKEDVFTYPIKSSRLNIYKAKIHDSTSFKIVLGPRDIQCKLVCVDHYEYLYFIPLLHTFQ